MPPSLAQSQYPLPLFDAAIVVYRLVQMDRAGRAVELGVAVGEICSSLAQSQYPLPDGVDDIAYDRFVEVDRAGGAVENVCRCRRRCRRRLAQSQYPLPVGVVAIATMGLFRWMPAGRAVELGVAEAEDPTIGTREPQPLAARRVRTGNQGQRERVRAS